MSMFERASRLSLRFDSVRGNLSTDDLWDLSPPALNVVAKGLNALLKEMKEEDFLAVPKEAEDNDVQLSFDIVLHVLNTKVAERDARRDEKMKKEKREKLMEILARKQAGSLENLSEDELKKMIEETLTD